MKKIALIVIILLLLIIMSIPKPNKLKDGGSTEYNAILYSVTDVKKLNTDVDSENMYIEGTIIKILGIEIYNNVD